MSDLLVVLFLVLLEGLLSFDNALALAVMVKSLPVTHQRKALTYGMVGAFGFRGLSLFFLTYLLNNSWFRIAGGLYLGYLGATHFFFRGRVEEEPKPFSATQFWKVIVMVEITDMAFSIDSIFAAAGMSSKLWVILTGGILGIIMMRFAANLFIGLLGRFPRLEDTAYLLISIVGIKLLLEVYGVDFEAQLASVALWGMMISSLIYGFIPLENSAREYV